MSFPARRLFYTTSARAAAERRQRQFEPSRSAAGLIEEDQ